MISSVYHYYGFIQSISNPIAGYSCHYIVEACLLNLYRGYFFLDGSVIYLFIYLISTNLSSACYSVGSVLGNERINNSHSLSSVRLASSRWYGMVRASIKHEATGLLIFLRVLECG